MKVSGEKRCYMNLHPNKKIIVIELFHGLNTGGHLIILLLFYFSNNFKMETNTALLAWKLNL